MADDKGKKKVAVDGVEYIYDDLSDTAKQNIQNIQFVDAQLQQLNNELAVADTARMGYSTALTRELTKSDNEA